MTDEFDALVEDEIELCDLFAFLGQWFLKNKKYLPINQISKSAREEYYKIIFLINEKEEKL